MGYLGNHLATIVTGVFAVILTALWPFFTGFAPVTDFIFVMAVPITWFLVFTCWIAQKSADYMHAHVDTEGEKKSLSHTIGTTILTTATTTATAVNNPDTSELQRIQDELGAELLDLKKSLKNKDDEIERLNRNITNLQTRVQIETLKAELADLKMMAAKQK